MTKAYHCNNCGSWFPKPLLRKLDSGSEVYVCPACKLPACYTWRESPGPL
jgi:DNA-directed RNA polymerase subunit RPC12/RpoP